MSDYYYPDHTWDSTWRRSRFKYEIRHCEILLNDDLSLDGRLTDQIAISDAIEHYYNQPAKNTKGTKEEELNFPEISISFIDSRIKAKTLQLAVFDAAEHHIVASDSDGIREVRYRSSSEQLAKGIYPRLEYQQVGRVRPLVETEDWDWETDGATKSFLYEEFWGGTRLFYNLTVILPELHVPYLIETSKRLRYVIGVRDKRVSIYFDNFKKSVNISIGYRHAPNTCNLLLENQKIILAHQSNVDGLINALRRSTNAIVTKDIHASRVPIPQQSKKGGNVMKDPKPSMRFFITHAHTDNAFAQQFADDLRKVGLDGFFDIYSIRPGDNIPVSISKGLAECDIYLPILSNAALDSSWCEEEITTAITLSKRRDRQDRPRIIPLLIEDCQYRISQEYPILLTRLYISFENRYDEALRDLVVKGFGLPADVL